MDKEKKTHYDSITNTNLNTNLDLGLISDTEISIPNDLNSEDFTKKMKTRLFYLSELTKNHKRNFINFKTNVNMLNTNAEENFECERLILAKSRKIEDIKEDSEVKFYMQKYLIYNENNNENNNEINNENNNENNNEDNNEINNEKNINNENEIKTIKKLQLINKEYKNIYKRTINTMKIDEAIIRKLLKTMNSDQIICFKIKKEKEINFFSEAIKQQKNLNRQKIEENKFDDYIIYIIGVYLVYNPLKEEPNVNNLREYEKILNKLLIQIRYLFEKKEYTYIIKDVNKYFSLFMQTKKVKEIFNTNKDLENRCHKLLEKIISIKILCIINKDNKEKKMDFQDAIDTIDKEYLKYFEFKINADDNIYLKNLGRKCRCYIDIKNLEKSKEVFNEIVKKFPNSIDVINELKFKIENYEKSLDIKNTKKSFSFRKNLSDILTIENVVNPFPQWEIANTKCENSSLNVDIGIRNYMMDY
jgi:hypothetical protein